MSFIYTHRHTHTHTHTYTLTTITTSKYRKCSLMPTLQPTTLHHPAPVNHWSDFLITMDSFTYQELHKSKNLDLLLLCLASFAQHIFENHLSYCVYEKFVPFCWSVRVSCMTRYTRSFIQSPIDELNCFQFYAIVIQATRNIHM